MAFEEPLIMRAVCYDSVELTGKTEYKFFDDEDDIAGDRINEESEVWLCKWILEHSLASPKYLFFEELGIDSSLERYFSVSKYLIKDKGKPGDIDILLVDRKHPQLSVAFQVKKVKGYIDSDNRSKLYTKNLPDVVEQTKLMYEKYRFHKNYLMLIVPTDAAHRVENYQTFRYSSPFEKKSIYNFNGFGDLPDNIGIFIYEINQPSLNSIDKTGVLSSKAIRLAKGIDQLNDTTERINKYIRSCNK